MNKVRKIATSIWWYNRYLKACVLLCGRDLKVEAGGTWKTKSGELVFCTSNYAQVDRTQIRKQSVKALVDGEMIWIYETRESYLVLEFSC